MLIDPPELDRGAPTGSRIVITELRPVVEMFGRDSPLCKVTDPGAIPGVRCYGAPPTAVHVRALSVVASKI